MAVTTALQTRYAVQKLFIVGLCVLMGAWGLYDYYVKIPQQAQRYDRGQVCLVVKQALETEPGSAEARTQITTAREAISAEVTQLVTTGVDSDAGAPTPAETVAAIKDRGDEGWAQTLVLFGGALEEATRRPPGVAPSRGFALAFDAAKAGVNATAELSPPSKFDRATQWMFILCLPCAPYFAWGLYRDRKRVYHLDDDGTLHTPRAKVTPDQIKGIDMSRWMRKSLATIETTDGHRIKLDDYVHRNVDKIVGAIASERHPEAWDENARPRKPDALSEAASAAEENAEEQAKEQAV